MQAGINNYCLLVLVHFNDLKNRTISQLSHNGQFLHLKQL